MSSLKTDNSFLKHKIKLRYDFLPDKKNINVLDCFHGSGKIWNAVKILSDKNINIVSLDVLKNSNSTIKCDNLKILKSHIDLNQFDIIDLDTYGIPFKQLEVLFDRKYTGIIFVTFIQTMYGMLPINFLKKIGISKSMLKKCPSLFCKNSLEKMCLYLCSYNIKYIYGYFFDRKNYFVINGDMQ